MDYVVSSICLAICFIFNLNHKTYLRINIRLSTILWLIIIAMYKIQSIDMMANLDNQSSIHKGSTEAGV